MSATIAKRAGPSAISCEVQNSLKELSYLRNRHMSGWHQKLSRTKKLTWQRGSAGHQFVSESDTHVSAFSVHRRKWWCNLSCPTPHNPYGKPQDPSHPKPANHADSYQDLDSKELSKSDSGAAEEERYKAHRHVCRVPRRRRDPIDSDHNNIIWEGCLLYKIVKLL